MILVTGATGRLGAALVHCLRKRSLPFAGVSGPNTRSEDSSIRFSADLADRGDVERVFGEIRPTAVIHAAALTDLDKCESNPAMAWSANTTSADNVAGVCAARGARLILISTDGVFEGRTGNY